MSRAPDKPGVISFGLGTPPVADSALIEKLAAADQQKLAEFEAGRGLYAAMAVIMNALKASKRKLSFFALGPFAEMVLDYYEKYYDGVIDEGMVRAILDPKFHTSFRVRIEPYLDDPDDFDSE
jgi:hypothetical protein